MGRGSNVKTIYIQDDLLDWWEEHRGECSTIVNDLVRSLIQKESAPVITKQKANKQHPSLHTAWDYYLKQTGSTRTLTEQRKNKLNARLNEVGPEKLKRAMDYLLGSPFHNGDNDRKWKWDIDFLIRNTEQVEKFSDLYQDTPKKKSLAEMFDEQ